MATKTNVDIAAQREDEAVLLRTRERLTFREIATRLGCDVKEAHGAWARARTRYAEEASKHHGAYVGEQLGLIDLAITGLVPKVIKGDVRAVEGLCRLLDQQAKLLGLYAPVKANVTVTDEMTARVKALAEELAGLDA
jgi:hypothetical protein